MIGLQANQAFVTGATYGGATMTLVQELFYGATGGHIAVYFLGTNANSGTQTFSVSCGGFFGNGVIAVQSLNADANMEVVDWDQVSSASIDDPSVTLSLGGRSSFAMLAASAGHIDVNTAPLSGWTAEREEGVGGANDYIYTYNTIGTADVTAGMTTASAAMTQMIALAVAEVAASGPVHPYVSITVSG